MDVTRGTRWTELRLEGGPLDGERLQRTYPPPSECVVVTLGGKPVEQLPRWLPTELDEDGKYRYETYILVGGDSGSYHYFYEPIARRNRLRRRW